MQENIYVVFWRRVNVGLTKRLDICKLAQLTAALMHKGLPGIKPHCKRENLNKFFGKDPAPAWLP